MFFCFSCRTPIYLRCAQEATAVEWFQDVQTAKVTDGWLGEGTRIPNTPIYVRNCYKRMRDLLFDEESLRSIDKQTYVVKGTPGIGKTTMLYCLLSECLSEASPFTAVLFATDDGVFVARKRAAGWHTEAFQRGSKVHQNGVGQAIGLVDVAPDGKIKNHAFLDFNQQKPCTVYGLHRLVVVASAGSELAQLIGKNGDGWVPDVLQLPVWRQQEFHSWLQRELPKLSEEDFGGNGERVGPELWFNCAALGSAVSTRQI